MAKKENYSTLLLSNVDIGKLVTLDQVVSSVEKTWAEAAFGRIVNPAKITLNLGESGQWPKYDAYMNAMPAYVGWLNSAGLKWAGGFWGNVNKGLPSISAMILLVDPKTGVFRAVMEGSLITALRTAAQSMVGMRYLAKKNFRTIGIYGAGAQAWHHSMMISRFYPKSEIKVFDVRPSAVQNFVNKLQKESKIKVEGCHEPEACSESDVVITLTTSKTPFFKAEWIRKGQTIAALGSYQEFYPEAITKANKIVVDNMQQTLHRGALKALSDKVAIEEKDISATIGEIIAGIKKGRENDEEIIFFEPIGTGMLDVAVATIAYKEAVKKGVGKKFQFMKL